MKKLLATMILLAFPVGAASAGDCVRVKVYNESDQDITALWTAAGCGGMKSYTAFICESKDLKARTGEASYNFPWGKSAQAVSFRFDGVNEAAGHKVLSTYTYHKNHTPHYRRCGFWDCLAATVPSCGHHYSIHFTNENVTSDSKWFME